MQNIKEWKQNINKRLVSYAQKAYLNFDPFQAWINLGPRLGHFKPGPTSSFFTCVCTKRLLLDIVSTSFRPNFKLESTWIQHCFESKFQAWFESKKFQHWTTSRSIRVENISTLKFRPVSSLNQHRSKVGAFQARTDIELFYLCIWLDSCMLMW